MRIKQCVSNRFTKSLMSRYFQYFQYSPFLIFFTILNISTLIRYASSTLGSGNLADVVRLPFGEDRNEWIAANSKININYFDIQIHLSF